MIKLLNFFRNLNREAATSAARNVLMAIGVGTVLADLNALPILYVCIAGCVLSLTWYLDYLRHF